MPVHVVCDVSPRSFPYPGTFYVSISPSYPVTCQYDKNLIKIKVDGFLIHVFVAYVPIQYPEFYRHMPRSVLCSMLQVPVVVRFVDIGGIVDHDCLHFLQ
jgi:hypothetical protein